VVLTSAALREVRRLPPDAAARVRGPLRALAANPRPPGAAQLAGSRFGRVRVADLRILYVIDDEARVVRVDRVVRRAESTYRRLR
jgi:mRNA interferase RelE/StbE